MLKSGHSGDGCELTSTLCKYDLRKHGLFVLSWASVRREMRGSISSELLMGGGVVCSILLLSLVVRCLVTIGVCIWSNMSCCCCLPTPLTLACGGSPIFSIVVHQPAYPSIWPAV